MKVSGGKLFVSRGEGPSVTRFGVNEQLDLVEEGRISSGAYTDGASMYVQQFISETKAYLVVAASEYVVWDPGRKRLVDPRLPAALRGLDVEDLGPNLGLVQDARATAEEL